ncbi:zinc ion binding nucleic acid binding protein [Senna tora]|uniref:Zinc ion binding nucleic acid binding protein n=1 Tax=Senna tora TaxID=362788 RepID=A0A834W5W0_9FABA|nr:zinc ion binding nucleic acid binding protein [Senna tora]
MECERATGNVESEYLSREEEDQLKRDTKKIKYGQEDHTVHSRVRVSYGDIGRDSDPIESHSQEEEDVQRRSYMESLLQGQGKNDNKNPNVTKENGNTGTNKNAEHGNMTQQMNKEGIAEDDVSGFSFEVDPEGDNACVFSCLEDYDAVLENGPWVIFDHYLIIRPWSPGFDPSIDMIQKLAVWVRFPDLPIEFFDNKFLRCFGNQLGKPVKVELPRCSRLGEDMPERYAHVSEGCPNKEEWEEPVEGENEEENGTDHGVHTKVQKVQKEKYGAWMTVTKSRRKRVGKNMDVTNQHKKPASGCMDKGGPSTVYANSRFEVLANEENILGEMEMRNGVRTEKGERDFHGQYAYEQ